MTVPLSYRKDRRVQLGDDAGIPLDALRERMRQAMAERDREARCSCAATARVQLQELMEVMDRLKDGGVETVGIVTQPARRDRGERWMR